MSFVTKKPSRASSRVLWLFTAGVGRGETFTCSLSHKNAVFKSKPKWTLHPHLSKASGLTKIFSPATLLILDMSPSIACTMDQCQTHFACGDFPYPEHHNSFFLEMMLSMRRSEKVNTQLSLRVLFVERYCGRGGDMSADCNQYIGVILQTSRHHSHPEYWWKTDTSAFIYFTNPALIQAWLMLPQHGNSVSLVHWVGWPHVISNTTSSTCYLSKWLISQN